MPPEASRDGYPVGIVGESNYQPAIRACRAGQSVQIMHEIGNPHDDDALVVYANGATIGYIPRTSFLQGAVHQQGRGVTATIKSIGAGTGGPFGVVLDAVLDDRGVRTIPYRPPGRPTPAAGPTVATSTGRVGGILRWLRR